MGDASPNVRGRHDGRKKQCYTQREYSQCEVLFPVSEPHAANGIPPAWGIFQQTFILASRVFESATAQFGLSYPQAAVLTVLSLRGRPLPLSHVARLLTQEAQSTTELADRLERRGYVQRVRDQRDRRLVLLELTAEGQAVIDRALPALHEAGRQLFGALDPPQLQQLTCLLLPLRDSAAEHLGLDRDRLQAALDAACIPCS